MVPSHGQGLGYPARVVLAAAVRIAASRAAASKSAGVGPPYAGGALLQLYPGASHMASGTSIALALPILIIENASVMYSANRVRLDFPPRMPARNLEVEAVEKPKFA